MNNSAKYIDFHTHKAPTNNEVISIVNVFLQKEFDTTKQKGDFVTSTGLHPWHIDDFKTYDITSFLEAALVQNQSVCIGECGLDRCIETDFSIQKEIFIQHVNVSQKLNLPIIIHCVRAYNDLIEIYKTHNKKNIAWIIHGYDANHQTTELLQKNNFYFSVGNAIFNENSKIRKSIEIINPKSLFFETDDCILSVETIYREAKLLLNTNIEDLKILIYNNFKQLF